MVSSNFKMALKFNLTAYLVVGGFTLSINLLFLFVEMITNYVMVNTVKYLFMADHVPASK
jgi:hypothetical protein